MKRFSCVVCIAVVAIWVPVVAQAAGARQEKTGTHAANLALEITWEGEKPVFIKVPGVCGGAGATISSYHGPSSQLGFQTSVSGDSVTVEATL